MGYRPAALGHWGAFPQAANQILLKGFNMQGDSLLSTTTSDEKGAFYLQYHHMWALLYSR
jgi:hypothetical protein